MREAITLDGTPDAIIGEVWPARDGWYARRTMPPVQRGRPLMERISHHDTRARAIAWLKERHAMSDEEREPR